MITGTCGNCGTQSSTLVIRGMAVDEIGLSDYFKAVWKELRVSILVGLALALVNMVRIYLQYKDMDLAIVIALTLIFCVVVAKLMGCSLPMLAKRLKLDPAIMASPMLSTLVDVSSVWIYFQIATVIIAKRG
nr:magnesium transporter [Eubacterium sp.]